MLSQSVFCRLGGYEEVNGADELPHDPAMPLIVGEQDTIGRRSSSCQMARFERARWRARKSVQTFGDSPPLGSTTLLGVGTFGPPGW
jgi:hypothetical protein